MSRARLCGVQRRFLFTEHFNHWLIIQGLEAGHRVFGQGVPVMKRLFLFGAMLACSAAANAQDSGGSGQSCSPADSPFIERVNVATTSRPSETSAVVEIDLAASLPDGRPLTYTFNVASGSVTSDGSHAIWTVEGDGPFSATVEVSAADYPCRSHANLAYSLEDPDSEGAIGEDPIVEEPIVEEPIEE